MLDMLKEKNGKLSFSRVWCSILLATYLFAVIINLFKTGKFIDVPLQFAGLISVLYGVNRFSNNNQSQL